MERERWSTIQIEINETMSKYFFFTTNSRHLLQNRLIKDDLLISPPSPSKDFRIARIRGKEEEAGL